MTEIFDETQERMLSMFDDGRLKADFVIPILVSAIRELESRLETLRAEVDAMQVLAEERIA